MNIKHYIYIKTKTKNKSQILLKLYKNNINIYDIKEDKDYLYLKVIDSSYKKIKQKIYTPKFSFVKDTGFYALKKRITPLLIFGILTFILTTNFLSRFIVNISVIHSNKEIREIVSKELNNYGIHFLSIKKDYNTLQTIKQNILNKYKDKLEWLEIENIGMSYIIRIEERIIKIEENSNNYCHVVASKSGIISKIIPLKGEPLVYNGQYVSEGDILISGEISYNNEIKNNVCAKGSIYAEVWYTTKISLPINYIETKRTGKKRINFALETNSGKYKILKSRLNTYETEEKVLFHFFDFTIYKYTEYETIETKKQYNSDTGLEKSLNLADEKINLKLNDGETIKTRKVLKKSLNDSTMDIEIFYVVLEQIGTQKEYTLPLENEVS